MLSANVVPLYTYRYYNRDAASSYAKTYTNNNGDCSTTGYNSLFTNYAYNCNDCTIFASQAVWPGFGGINDSTHINGMYQPMIAWDGMNPDWYATSSTTSSNWAGLQYFHSTVKDNWTYNRAGVQGYDGSVYVVEKGDIAIVGSDGHALVVTDATDSNGNGNTDYNEIKVSGHTNNRNDRPLSEIVVNPAEIGSYLYIIRWQAP
ncbi:MAG: amidase domain-containing protein [Dehalococcoidales bacterium]|nr:amidase domain-containing protein [Dehalococcoidales bacterium]